MIGGRPILGGLLLVATVCLSTKFGLAAEAKYTCEPFNKAVADTLAHSETITTVSPEQFQFLRGMAVADSSTPTALPPGDKAVITMHADGTSSFGFVDGEQICGLFRATKAFTDVITQVGKGEITHNGDPT